MTCTIGELKTELTEAGFISCQGQGSHTVWKHPDYPQKIILAGSDEDEAPHYLQKNVNVALNTLRKINDT
ncbi:MAG: type II toxin-antitoxin system HicA family toxin [Coleofasciculaceae cyanobacterium]